MPVDVAALLTEQHRDMEAGILGLVDGSGSRAEVTAAVRLLRKHIYVEEAFLFPAIERDPRRWMALAQMRHEHGDMWPHIETALALLDARAALDELLPGCEAMLRCLRAHDLKEEEAIYSAVERYRPDAQHPPLESLFETDAIPDGWKCRYAEEANAGIGY